MTQAIRHTVRMSASMQTVLPDPERRFVYTTSNPDDLITSLDELRKFVAGGGLEIVDGIGLKTAERIKQSLDRRSSN